MLISWIVAAALATVQTSPAEEQLPELPDHRTQFHLPPPEMRLTTEWRCGKSGKWSKATVRISDKPFVDERGDLLWTVTFAVELLSFRVREAKPSQGDLREVRDALRSLDKLSIFEGVCWGAQPGLFIKGYKWDGKRHQERIVRIELS